EASSGCQLPIQFECPLHTVTEARGPRGAHHHNLAGQLPSPGVASQNQQVQEGKQEKQQTRMVQVQFANARTEPGSNQMPGVLMLDDKTRFHQHFGETFFAEILGYEILPGVPRAKLFGRVFGQEAVYGEGQPSARLQDPKTFVQRRLRVLEMFEAAY